MKIKCNAYRLGDPAVYAHAKFDGHFTRVRKCNDGTLQVFTSHPTLITDKLPDHILGRFHSKLPLNSEVLGELWVPGEPASSVKTYIKAKSPELRFTGFAILSTPHRLKECDIEVASLEEIEDLFIYWGIEFAPFIRLQDGWTTTELFKWATDKIYEGWVLKDGNTCNWRKLKQRKTIDLIVDSFTEGDGKYIGQIGSMVVKTTEGHVVANVSGMDDDVRAELSLAPDSFIGAIVEVAYQYVGSGGKLRHPAFKCFRLDKKAHECSILQDPELEAYYNEH